MVDAERPVDAIATGDRGDAALGDRLLDDPRRPMEMASMIRDPTTCSLPAVTVMGWSIEGGCTNAVDAGSLVSAGSGSGCSLTCEEGFGSEASIVVFSTSSTVDLTSTG